MAAVDRARSLNSSHDVSSRDNLAAPVSRATSKGPESSAVSIASSDNRDDDVRKSTDGTADRLKSRNSDDGRSDTSTAHRRRMSRIFKGRSKRRKSATSQDDLSQLDPTEDIPPVPQVRRPSAEPRNYSDDSLGLHKSVASSLLTEDSDSDA
jgi:hypothetical protein